MSLGAFWTLVFTTVALLISAMVEGARQNLSLYNAILISYLCILHSFITLLVMIFRVYPMMEAIQKARQLKHRNTAARAVSLYKALSIEIATVIQFSASMIFGLYIWSRAETFGNQPECNPDTLLIVFGKSYYATTTHARIAAMGESSHDQSPLLQNLNH